MSTIELATFVRKVVRTVINDDVGQVVSQNDKLGDLGYRADSVLVLIQKVEDALNSDGSGPQTYWLPKGPEQRKLVNATVGGFQDWVYYQCKSEHAAGATP